MKKKPWIFLIIILILAGVIAFLFLPEKDAPKFDPKGVVISEVVFEEPYSANSYCGYDKEGRVVEVYSENHDNVVIKRNKYDANGYLVLVVNYDENGNVLGYITYDYIDGERHSKTYRYSPENALLYAEEYEYDQNLFPLREKKYDENDSLVQYKEYKYDENEILTGYVIYDRDGNVTETCEY